MGGTIKRFSGCPLVFGRGTCDKPVENVCLSALILSVLVYGVDSGGDLLHIYPVISVYRRKTVLNLF